MNIRPSWVTINNSTSQNFIETGPKSRDGEMAINIKVRENGQILNLFDIDLIGSHDKSTVLVRIVDRRTKETIFEERFKQ